MGTSLLATGCIARAGVPGRFRTRRPAFHHAGSPARGRKSRRAVGGIRRRLHVSERRMETVRFDVADRVATITLDRPGRKNAMNQQLKDELRACWQRVKAEPDIWAAIVTGAGEAFSSGADVESLATGGFTRPDRWRELAMIEGIRELPTPRRQLVHKPVIAAVNGVVAGFSLDLVTEADIPIASDKATFVDPHVSLGYVSSHEMVNMARRVPVAVCLRMAL